MKRKCFLLILVLILLAGNPAQVQDVVGDLLERVNNLRSGLGLAPYTLHPALMAAAQNHAQWMATTGEASHIELMAAVPVTGQQRQVITHNGSARISTLVGWRISTRHGSSG